MLSQQPSLQAGFGSVRDPLATGAGSLQGHTGTRGVIAYAVGAVEGGVLVQWGEVVEGCLRLAGVIYVSLKCEGRVLILQLVRLGVSWLNRVELTGQMKRVVVVEFVDEHFLNVMANWRA
jgi:hypothetical protein